MESSSEASIATPNPAQAATTLVTNHEEDAIVQSDFGKFVTEAKATGDLTAVSQVMADFINTSQGEVTSAEATPSASQAKLVTSQASEKDSASQAKDHLSSASMGVTGAVMTAAVGAARLKQAKNN